ncbi:MAG: hypothetical protein MR902_09730 [Campylobacter sp.]|nr:hypothetical protein [Campylobacter sp.]
MIEEALIKHKLFLRDQTTINSPFNARSYSVITGLNGENPAKNTAIFFRDAKSRFIKKDALKLENMALNLIAGKKFAKKILFINSAICSKAKDELIKNGWEIYDTL